MTPLTIEQQRELLRRQQAGWAIVDQLRRDELRGMPYNAADVDALLELGDYYTGPPRLTSGIADMQRIFMKARAAEQAKASAAPPRVD